MKPFGAFLAAAVLPVISAQVVRWAAQVIQVQSAPRSVLSAIVFLAFLYLAANHTFRAVLRFTAGDLLRAVPFAAGVIVISLAAMSRPPPDAWSGLAIGLTALLEEYVFRWALPITLASLMETANHRPRVLLLSIAVAQLSFSAAHIGTYPLRALIIADAVRFFAGGLLYAVIVATSGIGVAAGVHATMNLTLQHSESYKNLRTLLVISIVATNLGVAILWQDGFKRGGRYLDYLTSSRGRHAKSQAQGY